MEGSNSRLGSLGATVGRVLLVSLSVGFIIGSAIYTVFLELAARGRVYLLTSDLLFLWGVSFPAGVCAGATSGGLKNAVRAMVLIIFFVLIFSIVLCSMPIMMGVIADVTAQNYFIIRVISSVFYIFFTVVWAIVIAPLIGAFIVGG